MSNYPKDDYPEGYTLRRVDGLGRITKDSKWSPSRPWKSYRRGEALSCHPTPLAAKAHVGGRFETDKAHDARIQAIRDKASPDYKGAYGLMCNDPLDIVK